MAFGTQRATDQTMFEDNKTSSSALQRNINESESLKNRSEQQVGAFPAPQKGLLWEAIASQREKPLARALPPAFRSINISDDEEERVRAPPRPVAPNRAFSRRGREICGQHVAEEVWL